MTIEDQFYIIKWLYEYLICIFKMYMKIYMKIYIKLCKKINIIYYLSPRQTIWPHAMSAFEPCQVRNEAALRLISHVPWISCIVCFGDSFFENLYII